MFSRIGKETMIRDLTFVGQLKGSKGVESTFEKERKREAMGKRKAARGAGDATAGDFDDDDDENFQGFDLDDFYATGAHTQAKDAAVKGVKHAAAEKKDGKVAGAGQADKAGAAADDKDAKARRKDGKTKSQDVTAALMMGQQKQSLHTIFENIQAELDHDARVAKRKKIIGEVDTAREVELFNNMSSTFKSGVKRFES